MDLLRPVVRVEQVRVKALRWLWVPMGDQDPGDNESLAVIDTEISGALSTLSGSHAPLSRSVATTPKGPVRTWIEGQVAQVAARFLDFGARHGRLRGEDGGSDAMVRSGGVVARWISFPRGVRSVTATTFAVGVGVAAWGLASIAGPSLLVALAGYGAGLAVASASGPIGVRLANRLHSLVGRHRRKRISELRGLPDRRAVAVRGVVVAARTSASLLDGRSVVWSLTRFVRPWPSLPPRTFFHEVAFDFLLADGTDEPIWVEVSGGMLIDRFSPATRVQFENTTLLEIEHPFLTDLRLRGRAVRASEIAIAAGDVIEVVGRLSRRLDPTAPSDSGRDPPQRRVLRSGTRVPVMVRKVVGPDLDLARVRRLAPRGEPDSPSGDPPLRRF